MQEPAAYYGIAPYLDLLVQTQKDLIEALKRKVEELEKQLKQAKTEIGAKK